MATCDQCGEPITFRHIDGVVKPIHLDGNWCRGTLIDTPSSFQRPSSSLSYDYFVNPHASCRTCGSPVFYYENERGSKVYFDHLGPPWPKHSCFESRVTNGLESGQQKTVKPDEISSKSKRERQAPPKRVPHSLDGNWHIFLVYDISFLEEYSKRYEYYAISGYVCDGFFSLVVIPSSHVRFKKDAPFFVRAVRGNTFEVSTLIEQGSIYSYRVFGYSDIEDALRSRSRHLKTEFRDLIHSETDKTLKQGEQPSKDRYRSFSAIKGKRCKECKGFTKEYTYGTDDDRGTILMDVLAPPWIRHECNRVSPASNASKKWVAAKILHLKITKNSTLSMRIRTSSGENFRVIMEVVDFQFHPNMPLYVKKKGITSCVLSTITTGSKKKIYQHFMDGKIVLDE